jgi:hypothetical protein
MIRCSADYFSTRQASSQTLDRLKHSSDSFFDSFTLEDFKKVGQKFSKKTELDQERQGQALQALIKPPRRLEDLLEVKKVREATEASEGESEEAKKSRGTGIRQLEQLVNERYYFPCLLKSIGTVSATSFEKRQTSLREAFKCLKQLGVQGKFETLYCVLANKLSRNHFGKQLTVEPLKASQLIECFEQATTLHNSVVSCLLMMTEGQELTLSRTHVTGLKKMLLALAELLMKHFVKIGRVNSPFFDEEEFLSIKARVFSENIAAVLDIIRGVFVVGATRNTALFKEGLSFVLTDRIDELKEELHDEAIKIADLLTYYRTLADGYLKELSPHQSELSTLIETVNDRVNKQLDFLQKPHHVKMSLHKDGWQLLKTRLLLEAK